MRICPFFFNDTYRTRHVKRRSKRHVWITGLFTLGKEYMSIILGRTSDIISIPCFMVCVAVSANMYCMRRCVRMTSARSIASKNEVIVERECLPSSSCSYVLFLFHFLLILLLPYAQQITASSQTCSDKLWAVSTAITNRARTTFSHGSVHHVRGISVDGMKDPLSTHVRR